MSDPDTLKASRFGVTLGEVARLTIHLAEIIKVRVRGGVCACARSRFGLVLVELVVISVRQSMNPESVQPGYV